MAHLIRHLAVALVAVTGLAGVNALVPWHEMPRAAPVGYGPVAEMADTAGLNLPLRKQATTVPRVTVTQQPVNLTVGQAEHSAFPGLTRLPDGNLHLVWRQGKDHVASRDGDIMSATSTDDGASYSDVRTLRTVGDYRDPSVSFIDDAEGGTEHLTWFTGSAASPALGAFTMTPWGPTIRIDTLLYAAMTAPLVRLPDGRLGAAFYGRKTGESIDTSWMGWSADGGLHWTTNRITNMIGAGVHTNEPWLVADGTLTHFFYRWGSNDGIGIRTSTDSGKATWDAPRKILSNATGRPSVARADDGTLVMVYRERSTGAARIAYSADHAATWQDGGILAASKGGIGMTYAAMVPTDGGLVGVVGFEQVNGSVGSKLYGFRLAA